MAQGRQIYVFIFFLKLHLKIKPFSIHQIYTISSASYCLTSHHWLILPLLSESTVSAYTPTLTESTKRKAMNTQSKQQRFY